MKTHLICLLIAVTLLSACEEKKSARAYLEESFRLYREQVDGFDTAAIAAVLSEGLAAHPGDKTLLEARANLYCDRGMLPECRADAQRLMELKPNHAETRMMLCMLDEFEGVDMRTVEACYRDVVALLAARLAAAPPDMLNAEKFSYIFALLMARAPEAEKERDAFLESVQDNSHAWLYQEILLGFDRKQTLDSVFGQHLPENALPYSEDVAP